MKTFAIIFATSLLLGAWAMSYEQTLNELSTDAYTSSGTAGDFVYDSPELNIEKRDEKSLPGLHEILSKLPSLSVYSFDNAETLRSLGKAATEAYKKGNYGDFFYLWVVLNRNGNPREINDIATSEMQREIEKRMAGIPNVCLYLASTSTNDKVANLYKSIKDANLYKSDTDLRKTFEKRDRLVCNTDNVPGWNDCQHLLRDLDRDDRHYGDSKCRGSCCMSWSKSYVFTKNWLRRKLSLCNNRCIGKGKSCMIYGANYAGFLLSFCVGSTIGCSE